MKTDDDDIGQLYRARKEASQIKRAANRASSADILRQKGVIFSMPNDDIHIIIRREKFFIDFWPGTGLWIERNAGLRKRGIRSLLKHLGVE